MTTPPLPVVSRRPRISAVRWSAALGSGAVLWLVSPPLGLDWLHWVSFVPLLWSLSTTNHRQNAKLGYWSGWLATFVLFFWLVETVIRFSNIPYPVAVLILAIFSTAFSVPYAVVFGAVHWLRRRLDLWWVIAVPALAVALEKLAPALFPYYQGVSQYRNPWTWQLASVTGVMGVSYLVMLTNCTAAEAVFRRREGRPQPWALHGAVLAIFVANLAFGAWRHHAVEQFLASAPTLRASILQQGVTMEERLSSSPRAGLDDWLALTARVAPERPDLVVWPEGSVSYNPNSGRARALFSRLASEGGFDFMLGGGTIEKNPDPAKAPNGRKFTSYNSCYLFDRVGELSGRYDKNVPLPFGEYIPLSDTFPALKDIIEGPGDFQRGESPTVFEASYLRADGTPATYTFTTPICYEAILAGQMWRMKDADLFVNITNDAWFGATTAPHQHAMLAAVQSMELGRPMLRIAYTGVSFVVEAHGDIRFETAPFEEHASVETIRLGSVQTVYRRGGWIFGWLCVFGAATSIVVAWRRRVLTSA